MIGTGTPHGCARCAGDASRCPRRLPRRGSAASVAAFLATHGDPIRMHKGRLEAFSDGVIAILITIMVLEIKIPQGDTPAALIPQYPILLSYALSFVFLGIYWNNHHHMLQAAKHVDGRALWANMHLLFWLSLIPFGTAWMGESHFRPWPVAIYGVLLLLAACAYYLLSRVLIAVNGADSKLARALGEDRKGVVSLVLYAVAVGVALVAPLVSCAIYVLVAIVWLVPDRRIERALAED